MNQKQFFLLIICVFVLFCVYKLGTLQNLSTNDKNINIKSTIKPKNNNENKVEEKQEKKEKIDPKPNKDNNNNNNNNNIDDSKYKVFSDVWSELYNSSTHQQMIKPEIMAKTLEFMLKEVDEFDPNLINFVKTLIVQPSTKPLNLAEPNRKSFSQKGEDAVIDSVFNYSRNGFFVEAGGLDGELFSNSLFFERERGWTGILIEPIPLFFSSLLSKNRKIFAINVCIAKNKPMIARFRVSGGMSGRFNQMSDRFKQTLNKVDNRNEYIHIPCFSLHTIMAALGVSKIDFFSLDLEGGEWDVLSSIDLNKLDIKFFIIEHLDEVDRRERMKNYMLEKNYKLTKIDDWNMYLLKP